MIHEKYPSFYTKDNKIAKFKSAAAARADHIICNSQSTKRDVLELLGIPPEKVSVIYLGFSEHKNYLPSLMIWNVLWEIFYYLLACATAIKIFVV